jgi:two-component system, chemotaxis family, sensor kinase CheA
MKIDLSQFRQTFLQESAEHVMTMEAGLLDLRSAPTDTELLNAIFRSAHSIKGGAGSFGLNNLVRFTHALENLLDQLRSMEVPVTEAAIAVLLESVDVLRVLLEAGAEGEVAPMPAGAPELVARMEAFISGPGSVADGAPAPRPAGGKEAGADPTALHDSDLKVYTVELEPAREMFLSGANPIMLIRNLASLGTLTCCQVDTAGLPPLDGLDPGQCYLRWTIELTTARPEEELREVFEFVEHLAKITIHSSPAAPPAADLAVKPAALAVAGTAPPAKSTALEVVPDVAAATPAADGRRVAQRRAAEKKSGGGAEASSIRVSTDKVDRLIDLVGELVIAQVMTAQMVEGFTPGCLPKLREAVAAMERNTRELHERVMAVRMMPVGSLFQRYQRTVYDIAHTTGKQIRLEISGEETEIDKSMLEQLGDPLTHLIRNAADHGIELAGTRLEAGKTEEGVIHLRAFHRSGRVVIEVSDDGAGIDQARVYAKAVERGLVAAGTQLSEEQINMLLFEPGFSTRDEVSDLSGRGVGMDVVKRNVQQLSGTVSLASVKGSGSTVSIELPLTLAILDGLLVRVADRTLVLPLLAVIETVSPQAGQVSRVAEQGEVVVIRGESIPLLHLRRFLGISEIANGGMIGGAEGDQQRTLVIVVEAGRKKIGLVVEELLGQQQVVVKSLERNLHRIEGLMGATILGDGCVAPIVDVAVIAGMDLFTLQAPGSRQPRAILRQPQMQAS